ncbi:MAG TPA: hypothetical protein VNP04_02535 [Alphaproteobacteria bacterium]|nr:hypothetical protein [Alphaproteobacteria bacterium]
MFKHTLIQAAAYQLLLKSSRQQYHKRIAQGTVLMQLCKQWAFRSIATAAVLAGNSRRDGVQFDCECTREG